jgi:hypothetical protein
MLRGEGLRENRINRITVDSDCANADRDDHSIVDIPMRFDPWRSIFKRDVSVAADRTH